MNYHYILSTASISTVKGIKVFSVCIPQASNRFLVFHTCSKDAAP